MNIGFQEHELHPARKAGNLTSPLLSASALLLDGEGTHLNVRDVFKPSHADYTKVQQAPEIHIHWCLN